MKRLKLIPAASLGLVDDKPADELPARPAFETVDECANCAANAATVGVLRAENARLTRENAELRETACADGECGRCEYCKDAVAWNDELGRVKAERDLLRAERLTFAERAAVMEEDA